MMISYPCDSPRARPSCCCALHLMLWCSNSAVVLHCTTCCKVVPSSAALQQRSSAFIEECFRRVGQAEQVQIGASACRDGGEEGRSGQQQWLESAPPSSFAAHTAQQLLHTPQRQPELGLAERLHSGGCQVAEAQHLSEAVRHVVTPTCAREQNKRTGEGQSAHLRVALGSCAGTGAFSRSRASMISVSCAVKGELTAGVRLTAIPPRRMALSAGGRE